MKISDEFKEFLTSICKQRRKLMRINASKVNPQQADVVCVKIETWLQAHPQATMRGLATFFLNHQEEIYFITPSRFRDDVREKKFWHLLKESKSIVSSQLKIAI
ncbi:MAG: hypothetical protein KBH39_08175 [Chitinophagales bacterium]|nr:hypothetical protein [Chitinophagales bacterium]MBP9550192.1 hypothetical protein [Chitinophagales bacterium]